MSDRMMSVEEARAVLELDSAPLPMRQASRTIVHQAEQVERLQSAEGVLARLDREYAAVASRNPRPTRSGYAVGYLSGIDTAYAWLWKALEVPNE